MRSVFRAPGLVVLVALACSGVEEPCSRLGELCTAVSRERGVAVRVDDAVGIDLDGDGEEEMLALTRDAQQLALGRRDGWRSVVFLAEKPVALAGLSGEVAVALSEAPGVAMFGMDAEGRLERRRDLALARAPTDMWSGDLDGDGRPELLVAHAEGRLTRLDPGSGAAEVIAVGGVPQALAVGDLDGDAIADIVVADAAHSAVYVLRGAGGGKFGPAREFLGTAGVSGLALGDQDGDGDVDVLVRNGESPSVAVLHNNGAGELALPLLLGFAEPLPSGAGLVVGPASVEGLAGISVPRGERLDTLLREGTRWLGRVEEHLFEPATWVGEGTATGLLVGGVGYVARFVYAAGATPLEVWRDPNAGGATLAIGDLDGDGLLDLAVAADGSLNVLRGTATGFMAATTVPIDMAPVTMVIAEVTGDSRPDIVMSDREVVRVVQTGGDGSFTPRAGYQPAVPPLSLRVLRTGPDSRDVVAVVPNDIANAFEEPNLGAALLRYDGSGAVAEETALAGSLVVRALIGVDLDGDAVDEPLLFARRDGTPILMRMTPSPAGFELGPELDLSEFADPLPQSGEAAQLAAGDPDGDGELEVWIASSGLVPLRVFELDADSPTIVTSDGPPYYATDFRDVDGDGHVDAVDIGAYFGDFRYWRGHGDGTFDTEGYGYDLPDVVFKLTPEPSAQFDIAGIGDDGVATYRLHNIVRPVKRADDIGFHGRASELVSGDLDQDGDDDIVTISSDRHGGLQVLWGDPDGGFARADGINDFIETRGLTLGDLDGDGVSEVLVSSASAYVEAYRFWPRRERVPLLLAGLDSQTEIQDLAVADVDADGHQDVLALGYLRHDEVPGMRVYVAYGEGGEEFSEWTRPVLIPQLDWARLDVGDVDGDGLHDLLVVGSFAFERVPAMLALSDGPRAWSEPVTLPGVAAVFTPADAEGRVELLVHDGDTIARHPDGAPDQRRPLLRRPELDGSWLWKAADVDADGHADLVVITSMPVGQDIWLRREDGYVRALKVDDMYRVDVADVDGDRRPDLVGLAGSSVVVRLAGAD